ncbi:MAG TPA: PIN domain-containing protein [Clostridia bacterium]|nr:PIN domain-containing protein [Clostridia bacterium]
MIYLDTHVVIWMYQKDQQRFTQRGYSLIETEDLVISPMVQLEIEYLFEIKKITERSSVIIDYMRKQIGLHISDTHFSEVVQRAELLKWTRDPFDRLITAQADLQQASLLTKDGTIHTHYPGAVW